MMDWKIFHGDREPHDLLETLPPPPPWRFSHAIPALGRPADLALDAETVRAMPFIPSQGMVVAVNAALYLRRPLLITGKPGTGKSTLISKVAHELRMGPVIRWPINSRSSVRGGVYEYDAVGRLQAGHGAPPPVADYLVLGPLGTALTARSWPRPLLIDELDKSDLDFANDLLNVIEEGYYEIPELQRLGPDQARVSVRDALGQNVEVENGRIQGGQFPFVVVTSNAEREFPPAFLRRCVRLNIEPPTVAELTAIVKSHLERHGSTLPAKEIETLIAEFDERRKANHEVATDQLLNAMFLTVAVQSEQRSFSAGELAMLRENLLQQLSGPAA